MQNFKIAIAGKTVQLNVIHISAKAHFQDYICDGIPDFSVSISTGEIAFEREKSARTDALEGIPTRSFSDAYLEILAIQRKITEKLFDHNTLLFHGSTVAVDGDAYLFTAKSGTGKSTHTRFWREAFGERAVMVNDDKPFLRFEGNRVYAHGSPWNGKHCLGENICVPLKAICILERGPSNEIRKMEPAEALPILLQQSSRPMNPEKMPAYLDMIQALTERLSFYRMQCNMDPEAALVSYTAMSGKADGER